MIDFIYTTTYYKDVCPPGLPEIARTKEMNYVGGFPISYAPSLPRASCHRRNVHLEAKASRLLQQRDKAETRKGLPTLTEMQKANKLLYELRSADPAERSVLLQQRRTEIHAAYRTLRKFGQGSPNRRTTF